MSMRCSLLLSYIFLRIVTEFGKEGPPCEKKKIVNMIKALHCLEIQTMAYGCKMNRRDVGEMHHMLIPGVKNLRYRWVTRMRDDGRCYGRTPKVGVLIRSQIAEESNATAKNELSI